MNVVRTHGSRRISVGVVVATKDRWSVLRPLLEGLKREMLAQRVVVVDQSGERDRGRCAEWFALEAPENFARIEQAEANLPTARNAGWQACPTDVVVFLDDDVTPQDGWLDAHVQAYQNPDIGAVAGRVRETPCRYNASGISNRVLWYGRVWCHLDLDGDCDVASTRGANMSFRRIALDASGGFDPGFAGTHYLEESDLCYRLRAEGWRIGYRSKADVWHHQTPTGGCRPPTPRHALEWRCHNTGRFQRRHRGALGTLGGAAYALWLGVAAGLRVRSTRLMLCGIQSYARGWRHGESEQEG